MKTWIALVAFAGLLGAADGDWIASAGGVAIRDAQGRITGVDLRNSWVTDGDLGQLASLPNLKYLDLSLNRITDLGMLKLKDLRAVEELKLFYCEYVTDEGLAAIKNWKHLKRLNVRGAKVTDTTLEHLAGIETLEALDIGQAMVTDVGLDRIAGLPNLKELSLGGNKLTDVGLQPLRQMRGLQILNLSGSQRTDSGVWTVSLTELGVSTLATLKDLKELHVDQSLFSARSIEKIKGLTKLERLSCQGCKRLGDDAIPLLAAMPALHILDLKGTAVTEKGLAELKQAKPKAQIFFGPWEGPKMPQRGA